MNFAEAFKQGQMGKNFGLPTGMPRLDRAIDGVQKKAIYGVGAAPKVGKTTFVDYSFVLSPYLYLINNSNVEVEWIYFSYEIDRVRKEFKYASFFFNHDYKLNSFTHKGKIYQISSRYLMGRLKDDDGKAIIVTKDHEAILQEIYRNRIIPIFGKYDIRGRRIQKGKIDFIEQRDTPIGIKSYLLHHAAANGTFIKEGFKVGNLNKTRIIGYEAKKPDKFTIIVTDHIRKLLQPKGMNNKKQNIDNFIADQVELRNWCNWTFVDICHLNRGMSNIERMKYQSHLIYPTGEDFKDTGNLSEEADFIITMMNPNDEKFGLEKHFDLDLRQGGELLYPNCRSLHLVESRDTECPKHLHANMYGNINLFQTI